jgi:hypothetical protein
MKRNSAARTWDPIAFFRSFKQFFRPLRRGRGKPVRKTFRPRLERLETRLAPANADVLSFHNDSFLTGQNLQEEVLTPANVNATSFGKLFSQPVDGPIYAQPLYKANLMIGGTPHNVAFVATEHDSVYAFDLVDNPVTGLSATQLWKTSFINTAAGITPIPASELGNPDIVPEIGITGTPVIDGSTNTLYVDARTREVRGSVVHYVQKLHALDITTGAEKFGGPYTIGDTTQGGPDGGWTNTTSIVVAGTGDGAGPDGMVRFNAARQLQRPALQLASGVVYVAWASQADFRPYHGWVIGFNASTLQPVRWFNTTPNAGGAGIWESGGGLSVDPQGNLYFAEGNGFGANAYDPAHGNYSESVLKLSPSGSQFNVADYFTPHEWQTLDIQDADLGSGGVMLLPDFVGSAAHPHLMVELGKSGKLYLIDRDNMGRLNNPGPDPTGGPDLVVQTVTAGQRGVWGNPAFFQVNATTGIIYYHGSDDVLKGYMITNGHIDDTNILRSNFLSQFPGTQPVVSANGIASPTSPTNSIVWELQVDAHGLGQQPNTPAILRAFSTTNLATELYDSSQTGLRDQPDHGNKFTSLTVTNGHGLIGTFGFFSVYGLFPTATAAPPPRSNLTAMLQSGSAGPQIQLTWTGTPPTQGAAPTGFKILRSTDGTNFTLYTTVARDQTSFTDVGPLVVGQRYYYEVVATNQQGDSTPSNMVNAAVPIGSSALTLTGVGASSVGLSWTPVANDHYAIERSTDGTTFTAIATVPAFQTSYTDAGLAPGIYAYRIHAFNTNPNAESLSNVLGASVGPSIDHGTAFTNTTDLTSNGSTQFADTTVRLTNGPTQTGSAFSNTRVTTARFTTTFQLRVHEGTQPNYADGVTFVLQANAPTALGQGLGGLGYQGISHSVAVKFSTFQHAGDPSSSSTGLVLNGANPAGGMDTTSSGVLLNSQDQKQVTLTYDGTTLTERIEDIQTHQVFTTSFTVNIPQILGSDTAYVGFTGATGSGSVEGGYYELQDIVNWTFTSQAPLPGAPGNLRVPSSTASEIDLAWNANSFNETGFQVERSTDNMNFTLVGTTTATSFKDVGLAGGTYYYRVRAVNGAGNSPYSNVLPTGLPGPILTQDQDVGTPGDPAVPGSATFSAGGAYTVSGAGSDIWNQADGFHFVYKPLLGDGMITARVLSMSSIQSTTFWAKAGVMIRETLAGNSRDAYVTMTPQGHNQVQFLDRVDTSGNAADIGDAFNIPFPIWVRVVRQGNTFTGFYSTDGTMFIQLGGPVTIAMAPTVYVGLVASSANNNGSNPNAVSTSMFDNVSVVPAVLQTSHLEVSAALPAVNPGMPASITVTALDAFNNRVTGYRGTVHFTSSDSAAGVVLPADYTFTAADNGRHTFQVTLQTLGRQTVFATDTATGVIMGGSAVLVTSQPVLGSLVVSGFPSPAIGGAPGNFTVTAADPYGNAVAGYRGTVHFASSDPRAQLPADYTFTMADAGMHTFSATLNTPGTQSITVTDAGAGISGVQSGIQVVAPPALTTVSRSSAVINQGDTLTVGGTFTDPVTQAHTVVVSWGDNTANTSLPLASGVLTFSTSHPYAQGGNFEIHVTVMGANGGSDTATLTASAASVAPPSGLVGWWTGDGTNPTTAPDVAGSNPGTLVGGATHAPGEVGNAFSFNGNNQWVVIPTGTNIPVGNAPYTLIAWIKPNGAGNEGIIGYGNYGSNNQTNAFRLLDDGTGHLNFRHYWWANDLDAFTTIPANSGVWHLAVAEFDGTTRRIVLDGQVIAMDTPTGHNVPNTANFAIGVTDFNGFGGETFNGLIDEAQVYNRALALPEIQALFSAGSAGEIKGVRVQVVPPPSITAISHSAAINEGGLLTVSGTFTDPVAGQTHTAIVSWGDNTTNAMLPLAAGVLAFNASHTYAEEGDYEIHVTVTGANGQSDTVILPVTAASVAPPSGLVGWWTGDGNSPTTAPDLAGNNPGTLVNGATHAAGEVGNAFSFNGNGQYVGLPTGTNIPVGNATYTLLAWIKPNGAGNEGIIGYGNYGNTNQVNAFRLLDNGTGHLNLLNYWWANDLEADTTIPANSGAWHLAVAEFDGTTRRILLDGQVIASDTPTGHNVPGPSNFRIGSTNLGEFFNGLIDEAQVYNRALTLPEIQALFSAGAAGEVKGVRVNDVPVTATGGFTVAAVAGVTSRMQTVATFTDPSGPEALADYSAAINWGDNTAPSAGTISYNAATGVFAVQGSHLYTQAGSPTITVTVRHDTAPDATAVSTAQVSPLVVHFLVGGFPSPTVAGNAGGFTVTAQDQLGETVSGYGGTVHFTSSDPQALLPPDYPFTAADAGTHPFSATLKTAGTQSITATDTADSGVTGSQSGIVVNAAALSQLVVAGFPSAITAGNLGNFTVTAADPYGNAVAGYRGTVRFTSSASQALLPPDYTFTAADGGRVNFDAALFTAGTQSITATDTATPGLAGTQGNIVVAPAAASTLIVSGYPTPTTAGTAHPFTVTARDAYGNVATGYTGVVHFASGDAQAMLPDDSALTNGTGSFSATFKTAGTQSLTAADTATAGVTGAQAGIVVTPAAASSFLVFDFPSPTTAGAVGAVTVAAEDAYGNLATDYRGTARLTSSDPQAQLQGDHTFTAADGARFTFGAVLKTAGTQSLTVTDTATASITGSQAGIAVTPAAAGSFVVSASPAALTAGDSAAVTVTAYDAYGNVATGYAGTVHFTSSDGQAVLPADATLTDGTGTFAATLKTAGNQTVTATADGSITGFATVTVNPAAATHLVLSSSANPVKDQAWSVTVTAYDAYGNVATGYTGTVHFSSSDDNPNVVLPDDYTFTAADGGTHTFSGVTFHRLGQQSLTVTDTLDASINGLINVLVQNPGQGGQ